MIDQKLKKKLYNAVEIWLAEESRRRGEYGHGFIGEIRERENGDTVADIATTVNITNLIGHLHKAIKP